MQKVITFLMMLFLSLAINAQITQAAKVKSGKLIHYEKFKSNFIEPRNVDIWLPDDYSSSKRYNVLYMHDGQMLFDPSITWNQTAWNVDDTFGELLQRKIIKNTIVVGIWNIPKSRYADYFPEKIIQNIPEPTKSKILGSQLAQNPNADNYLKFIVNELKPFIDKVYATKKDVNSTFIMGSSMGGLISLYALCEYPKVFGGAACLSIHSPMASAELIDDKTDDNVASKFRDYLKDHLPKANTKKIYIDYGNKTLDSLYKPFQDKMDLVLKEKGYTGEYWQTMFFAGEDHTEKAWARRLYLPVIFLLEDKSTRIKE